MTDEFENALRRALRLREPGEDFSRQVVAHLDSSGRPPAPAARLLAIRGRVLRSRWLPVALAAGIVAGIGLIHLHQRAIDARADQARAQLLQALSIASDNINIVRTAVAREENPDS